jgi:hypothetical protein
VGRGKRTRLPPGQNRMRELQSRAQPPQPSTYCSQKAGNTEARQCGISAAIASPSRCSLLISNACCGSGVFGYAARAVRKMSLPSPQSRRIRRLAKLVARRPTSGRSVSCVASALCQCPSVTALQRVGTSFAALIADFCNKICSGRTLHLLTRSRAFVSRRLLVSRNRTNIVVASSLSGYAQNSSNWRRHKSPTVAFST